ncbi:MAG: DNA gyrase subunit B, partial [Methylococcales bacterium]|nr:DNA gyrase subunit B [Methylococcales bacterium]
HQYVAELERDDQMTYHLPCVKIRQHGFEHTVHFPLEFFTSKDYKEMTRLSAHFIGLIEEGAKVTRAEKSQSIENFEQAVDWLMNEAKRGQSIQRYKGLGEMNPEQLWETTMDPNVRRMMQVTIEDAVAADEIFTTLMGDEVDPRREFIETHALDAENIDV